MHYFELHSWTNCLWMVYCLINWYGEKYLQVTCLIFCNCLLISLQNRSSQAGIFALETDIQVHSCLLNDITINKYMIGQPSLCVFVMYHQMCPRLSLKAPWEKPQLVQRLIVADIEVPPSVIGFRMTGRWSIQLVVVSKVGLGSCCASTANKIGIYQIEQWMSEQPADCIFNMAAASPTICFRRCVDEP